MNKRRAYLLFVIFEVLAMASLFTPIYQVIIGDAEYGEAYLAMFYESFALQEGNLVMASYIFFIVTLLGVAFGIILMVKALLTKDKKGDKEDKFFVFGCFASAISYAFFCLMTLGIQSFIPMALSLLYALLTAAMIFVHHRFLTDY